MSKDSPMEDAVTLGRSECISVSLGIYILFLTSSSTSAMEELISQEEACSHTPKSGLWNIDFHTTVKRYCQLSLPWTSSDRAGSQNTTVAIYPEL